MVIQQALANAAATFEQHCEGFMPALLGSLGGWFQSQVADRSTLLGTLAVSLKSRSFYYTFLYSSLIVGFGIARIRRRKTPYFTLQTIVLMLVQVGMSVTVRMRMGLTSEALR